MKPSAANSDYPKFVADQVLTSDNLNDLFGYLDEQGRLTRTNLSGIGIVCGLEVKTAADGSSITITKGVGVTSSGYLVSVPEVTYSKRTSAVFNAVKSEYYSKFVNISAKTQKFDLWELKQEAETEGTTLLNKSFLASGEKIVLIFVELLEENNKNCDPNSCDDKGINVTVNFRPLLIEKANVAELLEGTGSAVSPWLSLPEISMRRFDVTANPLFECLNIFDAYRKILNNAFLTQAQTALSQSYNVLKPLLVDDFPDNPFATLANDFKFLNDGSISSAQLIALQYYYDLFSDILLAYNEFREKGMEFIGVCCPDDIFPRHLLLDLAIPDTTALTSSYRHYFMPSPILGEQKNTVTHLKILFKKLVLLVKKFAVPAPTISAANRITDANIRITPSVLANVPLSGKSIPYYYAINNSSDQLLQNWSPEKLLRGKTKRNLSYHAANYNPTDDDIKQPLLYDLEPFNFLRIEGHIGKPYTHAVKNITAIRDKNRLPFDIVALSADVSSINSYIKDLAKLLTTSTSGTEVSLETVVGTSCHFNDLELLFDSIMAELTGKLSNEMKFFYDLKRDAQRKALTDAASNIPQVPLLKKTDTTFRFTNNSIGHEFELYYGTVSDLQFIPLQVYFQTFGQEGNTDLMDFVFKAVLYYIEMLYETVTTSLSSFTFYDFYIRYYTLIQAVKYIKFLNKFLSERFPLSEEENDHLDALLSITADSRMLQLYMEFLRRILQVKIMQQAGFYLLSNPGIQHKAGVPMGGTFILIYHEADKVEVNLNSNIRTNESFAFKADTQEKAVVAEVSAEKASVNVSSSDHLQILSAGVNEKVLGAKDRVISGLRKTINTNTFTAEKATEKPLVAEEKATITNNPAAATIGTVGVTQSEKSQDINQRILSYLVESAAYLKNRKQDQLDEAISEFNDGVVIADFYLPYLCCSDCPPIQMVVTGETEKPNQSPVARPGDNVSIQLPLNSVTLDGSSSSDPDGTVNSYLWELKSGDGANIENPEQSKTNVSELKEGTYNFSLTVTDNDGAQNSATVSVVVLPSANVPPVASAFAKPDQVTLSANGTAVTQISGIESKDADGEIKAFKWSITSGPTGGAIISNPTLAASLVTFTQIGLYVLQLIVTDDQGASDTTSVSVTVSESQNLPPIAVASATPASVVLVPGRPTSVQLDGSRSSDPDGTITSFQWTITSGQTSAIINTPNESKTAVQLSQPGNYQFRLAVTDNRGASDSTLVSVTAVLAENLPPVAVASATPSTLVLSAGQQATIQLEGGSSSDPDGAITSFQWTITSGQTSAIINAPNESKTAVQLSQPGNYQFNLAVTDSLGKSDSTSVPVVVTQKTCPLLANIISDFDKISGSDSPTNLRLFTGRYPDFREIAAVFNLMKTSNVVNLSVENQIKFFIDQKIEMLLVKWITNLRVIILEFENLRTLSLLTFNLLTQLAYFISCIQKADVKEADVKMSESLSLVNTVLVNMLQVVANFLPEHRNLLQVLQKLSTDERARLKNNSDEATKPAYAELLASILTTLKAMGL